MCLSEIEFTISQEEYQNFEKFPIRKEYEHGEPPHKLVVFINKFLEIENFSIEEVLDEEVRYSEDVTKQVLEDIDLTDKEIELYFKTTGRDAVSIGEMALLVDLPELEIKEIADKFIRKGLFKRIIGATPHYTALPPYAALISQLDKFHNYISEIKSEVPDQLNKSFSQLESNAQGLQELNEYTEYMGELKSNMEQNLETRRQQFDDTISKVDQIKHIKQDIISLGSTIKDIMYSQMDNLKEEFQQINHTMSESMSQQLEGLSQEFNHVHERISESMNLQIQDLSEQFEVINEKISEIIEKQISLLKDQIEKIKAKLSKNLEKLKLGVLQETVDIVIEEVFSLWIEKVTKDLNEHLNEIQEVFKKGIEETIESMREQLTQVQEITENGIVKARIGLKRQTKVIQDKFSEGIEKINERFNEIISTKLKNSIDSTIHEIDAITTATAASSDKIKEIFEDLSKNLDEILVKAGEKISGVSENVEQSFADLREVFTSKIVNTLVNVLDKILKKLELSEKTTEQFWEKAKEVSLFTMKDIWFIRSEEGAKAQINSEMVKAKSKVLVVTPSITDVDLEKIKECPKHVNVRICSNIDKSKEDHKIMLNELDSIPNATYRHRELQNLWGINKDYEEVIICVISETNIDEKSTKEIAGIGSIIQEHIKIFVPILEDAWLGSRKNF